MLIERFEQEIEKLRRVFDVCHSMVAHFMRRRKRFIALLNILTTSFILHSALNLV